MKQNNKIKTALRPFYAPLLNSLHDLFFGAKRYHALYDAIKRTRALRIMEIGTWRGDRAVKMITLAQRLNRNEKVEYYGFDLFESLDQTLFVDEISKWPPTQKEVEEKLMATGASIHLYKGNTQTVLPESLTSLPPMDFIFIDGGHSQETILNDWMNSKELMHDKTVVIFDDYWPESLTEGAKPIVDSIDTSLYNVEILPTVDRFTNKDFGKLVIRFAEITKK